jgi:hypothetical protein
MGTPQNAGPIEGRGRWIGGMIAHPRVQSALFFSLLSIVHEPRTRPAVSVCHQLCGQRTLRRTPGPRGHEHLRSGARSICLSAASGGESLQDAPWQRQEWDNRIRVDIRYDGEGFAGWQTGSSDAPRTVHFLVRAACRDAFGAPDIELVQPPATDIATEAPHARL